MLRIQPIKDARKAEIYYGQSDAGYYLQPGDERREWIGDGAAKLGLTDQAPQFEQFQRLLNGLDPHTGKQLTAKLIEDRLAGWDISVSCPKGVTTAAERGDTRISDELWAAARETLNEDIQPYVTTRVRKGGKYEDRRTGNLVAFGVEHFETRPTKDDHMPDWQRHLHLVMFNETFDEVEGKWKAVKFRPVMDLKKLFDRQFNQRFSKKMADLGYEIETKWESDGKGGRKYLTWDIKGIPQTVLDKTSRRSQEIAETEKKIVAAIKARDPDAPDELSAVASDKLGGTTRLHKREDLSLADLRAYWNGRITEDEGRQIAGTIKQAMLGRNPVPKPKAAEAVDWAIRHHFERSSVVDHDVLLVTAMERSMGAATPKDIEREAVRQGVLVKDGEATTRQTLAQEDRITGFAREGRGCWKPLSTADAPLDGLSDEQKAAVRHVWRSTDGLMLIRGGAGTGKTTMMTPALARLGAPVALLAPSSDASRGQLRAEGFKDANTVAAFLVNEEMQDGIKNGGIIWVDEAGLLPIKDLEGLCDIAKKKQARIVLQGDPKQHKAVQKHGNMLTVLADYAGLPVAELREIKRQKGDYAKAVAAIRDGDLKQGDAVLRKLGWVVEGQGHDRLVEEYGRAIEETKPDGSKKTVLVIDPTHKDGDALSDKLRELRKDKGLIDRQDKTFTRLVAIDMTDAQKSDADYYGGGEIIQFFRNSGPFKAGQRVKASDMLAQLGKLKAGHFAVFREEELKLAKGDAVRITNNGFDITGKHRIDNGRIDEIKGFTVDGDPILANGWVISKDFGHVKHGLVSTSPAAQSKTYDVVLAAMNRTSGGAMGAEQGYVTVSRGRERGMIFTDLSKDELLDAIRRADKRKSATELMRPKPQAEAKSWDRAWWSYLETMRSTYRRLRASAASRSAALARHVTIQREVSHGRDRAR
jgi:conjugative relaxase-like TrwC/TraI family protein